MRHVLTSCFFGGMPEMERPREKKGFWASSG